MCFLIIKKKPSNKSAQSNFPYFHKVFFLRLLKFPLSGDIYLQQQLVWPRVSLPCWHVFYVAGHGSKPRTMATSQAPPLFALGGVSCDGVMRQWEGVWRGSGFGL